MEEEGWVVSFKLIVMVSSGKRKERYRLRFTVDGADAQPTYSNAFVVRSKKSKVCCVLDTAAGDG